MSRKVYMRAPVITEVPGDDKDHNEHKKGRRRNRKCCGRRRVVENETSDAEETSASKVCCCPKRTNLQTPIEAFESSNLTDRIEASNGKGTSEIRHTSLDLKQTRKKCCCLCYCCCVKRCSSHPADPHVTTIDIERTPRKICCAKCSGEEAKIARKKCQNCCKRTLAFFFSHVGLCSLVVGYSIAGGFIFQALESPFELQERSNVAAVRHRYVEILWNITARLNILYDVNWTQETDEVLSEFQLEVYRATKEKGWSGHDGVQELQWSFTGALLYSVTVITTIGYGHIAPRTRDGRLVTIFYALIGIPLTLLCLANLGSLFGDCFRFLYKHFIRFLSWLCLPAKRSRYRRSKLGSTREEQNPLRGHRRNREPGGSGDVDSGITQEKCDSDIDGDKEKEGPVRVPLFVSIILIALYIFGGAILFSTWEDDWDYLIGSYFCFITLSTIGFGDFVPGSSLDSWANEQKAVLCALYLVFGLSLIAMCFNLMQEEVKAKFRWLALKLNLIDLDEDKPRNQHSPAVL